MSTKTMFAADMGASGGKFFAGKIENNKLEMQELHRFAHDGMSFYIKNRDGTKNPLLNQFTANALGIPVVAGPIEGTAIGNLMVQAIGNGVIGSTLEGLPIIRNSFPITDWQPEDTATWESAYGRFKQIAQ